MAVKRRSTSGRTPGRKTPMVRKAGVTREKGRILCKGGKLKKR